MQALDLLTNVTRADALLATTAAMRFFQALSMRTGVEAFPHTIKRCSSTRLLVTMPVVLLSPSSNATQVNAAEAGIGVLVAI